MKELLRHTLAATAYRFRKAVSNCKNDFYAFDAGKGVRTPLEIVQHMRGVLYYASHMLTGFDRMQVVEGNWEYEISALLKALEDLDILLVDVEVTDELLKKLMQGPVSDVLTHVGQLAMLNRLNDRPVLKENFFKAPIATGKYRN